MKKLAVKRSILLLPSHVFFHFAFYNSRKNAVIKKILSTLFLFFVLMNSLWSQSYTLNYTSSNTYTSLSSAAVLANSYLNDNYTVSLGFNFVYLGKTYTDLKINSNGIVYFNGGAEHIDCMGATLTGRSGLGSEIRYKTGGSTGTHYATIEWYKTGFNKDSSGNSYLNLEISFNEASNSISVIYGNHSTLYTSYFTSSYPVLLLYDYKGSLKYSVNSSAQLVTSFSTLGGVPSNGDLFVFNYKAGTPSISILSPKLGDVWDDGTTHLIQWNSNDVTSLKVEISTDGGGNYTTLTNNLLSYNTYFSYQVPTLTKTDSNCVVRVSDVSNSSLYAASKTFILRHIQPKFNVKITVGGDSACWLDASRTGIKFSAVPINNATFWEWDFSSDDPNSGMSQHSYFAWEVTHVFASGPKNYKVHFKCTQPSLGTFDTCILLHIKGPMARFNLPDGYPVNNYYPVRPMPLSDFENMEKNLAGCSTQIIYSYFIRLPSHTTIVTDSTYCNSTSSVYSYSKMGNCNGDSISYPSSVKMKATGYVQYGVDSTETNQIVTWDPGSKIWTVKGGGTIAAGAVYDKVNGKWNTALFRSRPTSQTGGAPYYSSSGTFNYMNMHDSNLSSCKVPLMVRFTNNSIKYRLKKALDDNTEAYYPYLISPGTGGAPNGYYGGYPKPGGNGYKERCSNNYPWASDSLNYLWKFEDPNNRKCTSTSSGIVWQTGVTPISGTKPEQCNYSTLVAPYHYYTTTPANGTQVYLLKVSDPVTGCADSVTGIINMGSPRASWDKSSYCKMNWNTQQVLPAGNASNSPSLLRGFQLDQNRLASCAGDLYKYQIDFSETLPASGANNYWLVFDSAQAVKKSCYYRDANGNYVTFYNSKLGRTDTLKYYDYGFGGAANKSGYQIGGPKSVWIDPITWNSHYWYMQGDSGCKTVGVVIQSGKCFDTAWYHNYICFEKLKPEFRIIDYHNDTVLAGLIVWKGGFLPTATYNKNDLVYYYPNYYVSQNNGITNNIPPSSNWKALNFTGSYSASKTYNLYDEVIYANGNTYICLINNTLAANPPASPSNWELFTIRSNDQIASSLNIGSVRICQHGSQTQRVGVDIKLVPYDLNQKDVTRFQYTVSRMEYPAGEPYYAMPVWPDTAALLYKYKRDGSGNKVDSFLVNPFVNGTDSITSAKSSYYQTDANSLYTEIKDKNGNIILTIILGNVDLTKTELDSLNNYGKITRNKSDFMARYYNISCFTDNVVIKAVAGKTPLKVSTVSILNLSDPIKDDTKSLSDGTPIHDTVAFHLPYPGFYRVISSAANLEGCHAFSQFNIIYGHLARFNVVGDSIICVGDSVEFKPFVRYWVNWGVNGTCPGILPPDGCIDGQLIYGSSSDTKLFSGVLTAWDGNPAAPSPQYPRNLRKSLSGGQWSVQPGYQDEKIAWNFGDDKNFYTYTLGAKIKHQWTTPGVYSITMRTYDSTGCAINTQRHNFIKVIGIKPDFATSPLHDSIKICAPVAVVFVNNSGFLGGNVNVPGKFAYKDRVVRNGKVVDTIVVVDSLFTAEWNPGDGSQTITKKPTDSVRFFYKRNGKYLVDLKIKPAHSGKSCQATAEVKKTFEVHGPQPHFHIKGDTAGCPPLAIHVVNDSTHGLMYEWYKGDGTTENSGKGQTDVNLLYTKAGTYSLHVVMHDSIWDGILSKWTVCDGVWPDTGMRPIQVKVLASPDAGFTASKVTGRQYSFNAKNTTYSSYLWNFGDGNTGNSSSTTHTYNADGTYKVKLTVTDNNACILTDSQNLAVTISGIINPDNYAATDIKLYPNPFYDGFHISYDIIRSSQVRISLEDMEGNEIADIFKGEQEQGRYDYAYDARKLNLKGGIYIVRFMVNGEPGYKRIVMIK